MAIIAIIIKWLLSATDRGQAVWALSPVNLSASDAYGLIVRLPFFPPLGVQMTLSGYAGGGQAL